MLPVYFILVFWYFIFYTDTHMNTLCEYISGESYFTFVVSRVAPFFSFSFNLHFDGLYISYNVTMITA